MLRWYLITHNLHAFQMVTSRASALGVETFAPSKIKVTRRADCNGVRTTQTQLFPGYLFIRLDLNRCIRLSLLRFQAFENLCGLAVIFVRFQTP